MDCIFCKIVKSEIDCAKVFEDDDVMAFFDIGPLTRGHCLVIPKKHFENIFDIDKEVLKKIIVIGKNISEKIKESFGALGINLVNSNGKEAGQEIFHYHLHVIPRYENDELKMNELWRGTKKKSDIEGLKKLAEKIKI